VQPLRTSNALVGAFALVHSHGHAVSFLVEDGHVDLVLSHRMGDVSDDQHAAEAHLHSALVSEGAHIVHLTSADVTRDSARRAGEVDAQAAGFTLLAHWSVPPVRVPTSSREPLPQTSHLLQTVVLRI
jgi:hypothetical protein